MEEHHQCHHTDSSRKSPPVHAAGLPRPDDSSLARADATTASQSPGPLDHPATPTGRPRRSPRNGGGRWQPL